MNPLPGGTLTDAGPLIALVLQDDPYHARCAAVLPSLPLPLVTTQACLGEAMHLVGRGGGYLAQEALWELFRRGDLLIAETLREDNENARLYMERFRPYCDFGDATLLALAERVGYRRLFTSDGHLYAYRLADNSALEVLPGPG